MKTLLSLYARSALCLIGASVTLTGFHCGNKAESVTHNTTKDVGLASTPSQATGRIEWHPSTYQGLVLGKSTKADVERAFGKPVWAGPPEEKLTNDESEKELLYEYKNIGGVIGQTTIVLGVRTKVVKAIDIYPQPVLPLRQIVEQYGNKYVERESDLGPCPTEAQVHNYIPAKKREYPIFLVYPERGVYISVSEEKTVSHIGYLARCP